MKTYKGYRFSKALHVVVIDDYKAAPLHHLMLHSPDGFECGYGGGGPADLALAILADHLNENPNYRELRCGYFDFPESELLTVPTTERVTDVYESHRIKSLQMHQLFKTEVISRLPREGDWTIPEEQVTAWIADFEQRSKHES